jgi:hypothetical protein
VRTDAVSPLRVSDMDKVDIKHPRPHNTGRKAVPPVFVAAGTATGNIVRVVGRVTGHGQELVRHPFYWARRGGKCHWQMLFRVREPGRYALAVTGFSDTDAPLHHDTVTAFEVKDVLATRGIQTTYPDNNQDITDEKDYFIAYGVPTSDLLDATMTPTGGAAIHAETLNTELTVSPQFWSAQFPPLSAGTYRLDEQDASSGNDPRTGLLVT